MINWIKGAWKAVTAAIGMLITLLTALNAFPLPGAAHVWVASVLGVLTVISTYIVRNKTTAPKGA